MHALGSCFKGATWASRQPPSRVPGLTACSSISLGPLLLRLCISVSSCALVVITPRLSPSDDSTNTACGNDCRQHTSGVQRQTNRTCYRHRTSAALQLRSLPVKQLRRVSTRQHGCTAQEEHDSLSMTKRPLAPVLVGDATTVVSKHAYM
jgi:hypothetical protein